MFLATKLFLPPLPAGAVHRDRLYSALDDSWAAGARLLLLSAPPGYGKTTLLSVWVQQRGIPCAWVSLDASDSDPARFFLLLLHALKPHLPALEGLEPVLKLPRGADFESLAVEVVNAAVHLEQPLLVALDDYHAITSSAVHDLVQFLLEHLPPQLRLAVLTREDPPFHLARMRARRQMLELRAGELAFSEGEGQALLLDAQGLALDGQQIGRVLERTEGWAAGLQLAALTLRGHPDPARVIESFGGSHRYVLDYLFAEVLDRLPQDLRDFLCRSALLDHFNADLCDSALETSGSRAQIHRAAAANLFLIPLDEERDWFRYHHLMAEILKAEVPPAQRQAVQRRAALWWQARGQPAEAVRCALEARDFDLAATLIQTAALPAAENGLMTTALGWLEALPPETLRANPDLCVYRAWFLVFTGHFAEAIAWIGQLTARAAELPRPLAGLLAGIQGWMVTAAGQRMDLPALLEAYAMTEGRFPYFAPMMLLAIGQAQREAGDLPAARESFAAGIHLTEVSSGPVSALILRNNLAFLLEEMGERQVAAQICRDQIEIYSGVDGKPGLLAGIPMLPLGCFMYRSGELEAAYTILTQSINLVRRMGLYDILTAPANNSLEYVLADMGRLDEALALNREVRRRAAKRGLQIVAQEADWMAGWLQLRAGNIAPAVEWAQAHPLPAGTSVTSERQTGVFLHARVLAAAGEWQSAIDLLLPVLAYTRATGLLPAWVRASVELALVHHAAGDDAAAGEALAPALEAAARMDYRQVFRHARPELSPLYEQFRPQFPGFVAAICAGGEKAPRPAQRQAPVLVEPPGERELEILRLVAAGLSNAEIAQRLYLTVGTVKWYLNQIFGKLAVSRRTEAVARARELGLL
jgi:LuxR family maltose regulon positive regulatory protein